MTDKIEVISLPISEYRIPIYQQWDKDKRVCPHNSAGWMAYHLQLLKENQ